MTTGTTPYGTHYGTQYAAQTGWTGSGAGTCVPFETITEPGTYICSWSGHLLRVPEDAFAGAGTPSVNFVGTQPLYVTKLSANPFLTLTKARLLAANFDIAVNF